MKPLCELCGTRHESYQAHVFASNTASNKVSASNNGSDRKGAQENHQGRVGRSADGLGQSGAGLEGSEAQVGRKQRWSREAYNAYQREYMRRRRAKDASAS